MIKTLFLLLIFFTIISCKESKTPSESRTSSSTVYSSESSELSSETDTQETSLPKVQAIKKSFDEIPSEVKTTVQTLLKHIQEKNIDTINQNYIHPKVGLYDVYRIGVPDKFDVIFKLEISKIIYLLLKKICLSRSLFIIT